MKHIEKIEKEFDEKLLYKNPDGTRWHCMSLDEEQKIKSFLRQSHTSYIQNLIQRVEGERRGTKNYTNSHDAIMHSDFDEGFNTALDTIIKMLKEEIC